MGGVGTCDHCGSPTVRGWCVIGSCPGVEKGRYRDETAAESGASE